MKCNSIMKPLSVAQNYSQTPNNIDEAKYVYCANTVSKANENSTRFISIRDGVTNTVKATVMLGGNEYLIIEKDRTDTVHGTTGNGGAIQNQGNITFTKVALNGQS